MHDVRPMQIIMILDAFDVGGLDLVEEFGQLFLVEEPEAWDEVELVHGVQGHKR